MRKSILAPLGPFGISQHQKAVSTLNKGNQLWHSRVITTNNHYGQRRCLETSRCSSRFTLLANDVIVRIYNKPRDFRPPFEQSVAQASHPQILGQQNVGLRVIRQKFGLALHAFTSNQSSKQNMTVILYVLFRKNERKTLLLKEKLTHIQQREATAQDTLNEVLKVVSLLILFHHKMCTYR